MKHKVFGIFTGLLSTMRVDHIQINSRLSSIELRIYLVSLFVIIAAQTIHFVSYFNQPLFRSTMWAIVDWSIWFIIIGLVVRKGKLGSLLSKPSFKSLLLLPCVLFLPIVHSLLSQAVYSVFSESSVPLIQDIKRNLDKKWFQSSLIVIALLFGFNFTRKFRTKPHDSNLQGFVLFKDGKTILRVNHSEIRWILVEGNYLVIKTLQKELLIRSSLKRACDLLQPYGFVMVNRSTLINLSIIRSIEKVSKYKNIVHLEGEKTFPVGRTFLKNVKKSIESYTPVIIGGIHPK